MSITLNPMQTTVASGTFNVSSDGYVQGEAIPEPAIRYQLAGGIITDTIPLWGGVGITESLANASNTGPLGNNIARALTTAAITGFSVFNQANSWINTPQSPVPTGQAGQTASFYRLGSGAKIPLQIEATLAASIENGSVLNPQVSWDVGAQMLIKGETATAAIAISATAIAVVSSVVTVTMTSASAHGIAVGDFFDLSGFVPVAYNGTWQAISGTTGSTLKFILIGWTASPGAVTTEGQINARGGILPCSIIGLSLGNSKTVVYSDPAAGGNGNVTWNNTGNTALVLI